MKRHAIRTIKLLGIACGAVSATACYGAAPAPSGGETPAPVAQAEPAQDTDPAPRVEAQPTPPGAVVRSETPRAPGPATPELVALRDELEHAGPEKARADAPRFRPLCDAQGYPLVGNAMRKGPSGYQPSAFCANLRTKR